MKIIMKMSLTVMALLGIAFTVQALEYDSTQNVDADAWKTHSVTVKTDTTSTAPVVVTVTDGMSGYDPDNSATYGRDLEIKTHHPHDATLVFQNPTADQYLVFGGDATLTGIRDPSYVTGAPNPDNYTGWAKMQIGNGATVVVGGTLKLNDYGKVDISSTGTSGASLYAWGLTINGKESEVTVGAKGSLTIGSSVDQTNSATNITQGSLKLTDDGSATFYGTVSVNGENASLVMTGQSTINVMSSQASVTNSKTITLANKGQLLIDSSATAATINGNIENQTGIMQVDGTLTVNGAVAVASSQGTTINGSLTADSLRIFTRDLGSGNSTTGQVTIAAGGQLISDSVSVESGTLDIEGNLSHAASGSTALAISGGAVTVGASATVTMDAINASGGSLTTVAGSNLQVDSLQISGTGTGTIRGKVKAGAIVSVAGSGVLNLNSAADEIGDGTGLGRLGVSGTGTLNLNSSFTTDNLAVSGGTLNMNTGVLLTVNNDVVATGAISMNGGSFDFKGDVAISGGGSLTMNTTAASIEMNNKTLTVGSGGRLDTQAGSLTLTNSGGVVVDGTYVVGHDGTSSTMLISRGGGGLTVGSSASVQLNTDARRAFAQNTDPKGLLILDTDGAATPGSSLFWNSGSTVYYYDLVEIRAGEWGLYVTDSRTLTRQEQYANILGAWRKNDRVGDNVGNVINQSFLDAIVDGAALVEGSVPGYDKLSSSGKFNAEVLTSLVNPAHSGAGYDSLMLYNGSALTLANEAIVSANARLMRRIGDRNTIVRREVIREQAEDPEGYADYEPLDLEPDMARVWGDVLYHSDSGGHRDGFAGYKYRGAGLMLGADKRVGDVWVGGSIAYLGGSYDDSSALDSSSDIDTYAAIIYGGYQHESGIFLNASLGYAYSDNDLNDLRVLNGQSGRNRASFGSHSLMAGLAVGKDFQASDSFTVTPAVGFRYINTRHGSHTQSFSGGAETLKAGTISGHSATIPLDLALTYDLISDEERAFSITGMVGYEYEISNKGATGDIRYAGLYDIGPVRAVARTRGRHIVNLGVSTRYLYKNYEFGLAYDYSNRDKYNSHAITASAGMSF